MPRKRLCHDCECYDSTLSHKNPTMTKYGLRARVMAFTILPTLVIGILLAGYFPFHRHQQLESFIIEQGINVIEPLAIASEYGMHQNSREHLKRLIGLTHRKNSAFIKSIAIFNRDNQLLVTSNFHRELGILKLPDGEEIPELTTIDFRDDYIILRTPVLDETEYSEAIPQGDKELPVVGYIAIQINTDKALLIQYRDTAVALLVVIIGLIISTYFGFNLVNVVINPINRMVRAVYQIREGRLDTRVRGPMQGELDMLKNGINAMAKAIAEYHNEMQMNIDQATSDLRETLEQIEIQNVELDMAKKRAQEAARVKSEFLANMSHELRTPLNGVIGFAKQLMKTALAPNQSDYLSTIERSAKNLLNIINDILDFSKLEAGKLTLEQIPFSLRDVINETVTLLAPSAHDKGLELTLRIDSQLPDLISGDPLRLQQIVTNLAGNAIKFTEKGNVELQLEQNGESSNEHITLRITVRDTGIGMSPQQQQQLFQPFNQGDSSISRRYGGTGLGLVITQKLVQQMGGSIEVESRLEQGSTFRILLPLQLTTLTHEEQETPPSLAGESVLLIEPNEWSKEACSTQLQEWELQVTALAQLKDVGPLRNRYFNTLLLGLPAKPDLEAVQQWLASKPCQFDKLIMLVNSHEPKLQETLIALGADHVLNKPVSPSRLLAALQTKQPLAPETPLLLTRTPRPINVLAVDDNPANLKLIAALLEELVAEVHTCQNGRQAVELAHRMEFDLIFMDIQMPIMDGITASKAIRAEGCNQQTPIIAVTAHATPGERERLMAEGMDEYLAKPIDETQLERLLKLFAETKACSPSFRLLDPELALRQAAGKPQLAREMLSMLLEQLPGVHQRLYQLEDQDPKELLDTIHKLGGGAAYCGVPCLQALCIQIEQGLREGLSVDALEPELLELQDKLAQLEQEAKAWLTLR